MDANTLRKIIEAQITQFEGNAFQDMSDRLGSVLFPDDYHPVRAGGRHGDTKNDGYCPKARVFFAAHATRGESATKSKTKIKDDLEGCLQQHRDVKVWRFLTNDTLIGEADQYVDNELRANNPGITLEIWGHKRLAEEIGKLDHADIEKILDLNLPTPDNPKAEAVAAVNGIIMTILLDLNMYQDKQFNPQLRILESSIEDDRRQVENILGTVRRLFGKKSTFYIELEKISAGIHAALAVLHVMDGGVSHNKRLSHLEQTYEAAHRLFSHIGDSTTVKIPDLQPSLEDVQEQTYRWLKSIDFTLKPFFDEAESYAQQILRLHLMLILVGDDDLAMRYKEFADELEQLSWGTSNTDYMLAQDSIPRLALEARNLDLSKEEVELLVAATKNEGQISKLTVDALPGGFIKIGSQTYVSEADARQAAKYVEALGKLVQKRLVRHISDDRLFQLTAEAWKRLDADPASA